MVRHGLVFQHLTLGHSTEKLLILPPLDRGFPPGCPGSALALGSKKLEGGDGKGQAFLHSQTFPRVGLSCPGSPSTAAPKVPKTTAEGPHALK